MMALVAVALGSIGGLGIFLLIVAFTGEPPVAPSFVGRLRAWLVTIERLGLRIALAGGAMVIMAVLTGWIVGTVMAGIGAAAGPTLAGAKGRRQAAIGRTEALATWAEQLRDTISTAAGLREAISTSADVCPREIAPAVRELDIRLRSEPFGAAMRVFASRLADPTADKIAVALTIAAERRGRRLASVLTEIASAARQQAEMQLRTEAARARTYTQSLVVSVVLVLMLMALFVMSRDYLRPYDSLTGQLVLLVVFSGWAFAFIGLVSMSRVEIGERVLAVDSANAGVSHAEGVIAEVDAR